MMLKGTVKTIERSKGWGFIEDQEGYDYFFNVANVRKGQTLKKGTRVKFDAVETNKGSEAENISIY
tara:strand:- start:75 stop:272 length:198 start_codon:yes stop_codon:yes gene_type:complete